MTNFFDPCAFCQSHQSTQRKAAATLFQAAEMVAIHLFVVAVRLNIAETMKKASFLLLFGVNGGLSLATRID